jgi:EpsI family protein
MTSRREFLIGGACLASAGAAYTATPRRRMSLLGKAKLEDLVPRAFGSWAEVPSTGIVTPESDNSLAAKLYAQTVARIFSDGNGKSVMALLAYGDTQSDQLQLHRPEVCYPAFGFALLEAVSVPIRLSANAIVSGRRLTAQSTGRTEHIAYWTRIGEALPQTSDEQRSAKLKLALQGIIPDGILVRISNLEPTPDEGFALNQSFARELLTAMSAVGRRVLVGTELAARLNR